MYSTSRSSKPLCGFRGLLRPGSFPFRVGNSATTSKNRRLLGSRNAYDGQAPDPSKLRKFPVGKRLQQEEEILRCIRSCPHLWECRHHTMFSNTTGERWKPSALVSLCDRLPDKMLKKVVRCTACVVFAAFPRVLPYCCKTIPQLSSDESNELKMEPTSTWPASTITWASTQVRLDVGGNQAASGGPYQDLLLVRLWRPDCPSV